MSLTYVLAPSRMTKAVPVRVFLTPELATELDALRGDEKRSSWIRRMVRLAVDQSAAPSEKYHGDTFAEAAPIEPERPLKSTRLTIRLNREEADAVQGAAEQAGFTAASWVRQLVRRKLGIFRPYQHDIAEALWGLRYEVRKIGVNMNQATKAMRYAKTVEDSEAVRREARRLSEMAAQIAELGEGVGEAVKGDYRYWDTR